MTTIQIEKNIPVSKRMTGQKFGKFSRIESKTLVACDVGDSFLIEDKMAVPPLFALAKKRGLKITSRKEGSKIRIWRTA